MAGLACNSRKGEPIATGCCNPDPLIQFTALTRKLALFNLREAEQHALHCVSPSASSEKWAYRMIMRQDDAGNVASGELLV
jgi:hypothetical protein